MRRIGLILTILLWAVMSYAAPFDGAVGTFFPKAEELPGGSNRWFMDGIEEVQHPDCTVFTSAYAGMQNEAVTVFNIKRDTSWGVDVRILSCGNFVSALKRYEQLAKVGGVEQKGSIPFGERGTMFYESSKDNKDKAEYYLTFLTRVFVVQVHSDDGFAMMDVAGEIQKKITSYVLENRDKFLIRRLTMEVQGMGYYPVRETITFTNDNITSVVVSGKVFDNALRPVSGAKVLILETGTEVTSNPDGSYEIGFSMEGGGTLSFFRPFYLSSEGGFEGPVRSRLPDGMYAATVNYPVDGRTENDAWKMSVQNGIISGISYDLDSRRQFRLSGSVDGRTVRLIRNCSPAFSAFQCRQTFVGEINSGTVEGTWTGNGGGGAWSMDLFSYTTDVATRTLSSADVRMESLWFDESGNPIADLRQAKIASGDTPSWVRISPRKSLFDEGFFFKEASIELTHLPEGQNGALPLYIFPLGNTVTAQVLRSTTSDPNILVTENDKPYRLSIPVTGHILSGNGFIIGPRPGEPSDSLHLFALPNGLESDPVLKVVSYAPMKGSTPETPVAITFKKFDGDGDMVGNANLVRADGQKDIELELTLRAAGRTLRYLEVSAEGARGRKWNTNFLDIYPVIALTKAGKLLNQKDGSVAYAPSESKEIITLSLWKGTLVPDSVSKLTFRALIDDVWHTGTIALPEK